MAIKLVVFDIAGTTVKDDHEVSKAFQSALNKHNYNVALDVIDPLMGYEKTQAIRQILQLAEPDQEKIKPDLIRAIHRDFVQQMINIYLFEPHIEPLPNVEETFAALHLAGVKVALNTGFSRDIADTIVNRLKWREKGLVDHVIGSDEVEQGRPHPFMIHRLMQYCGINNPLEVAKVGDTEVDIREGQNALCRYVIGVTTGTFSRRELQTYHPTHLIDDIKEVVKIIQSKNDK